MTAVLLSVHVVAAIVLIGPMTAAASLFPRYARAASEADEGQDQGQGGDDGHSGVQGPVAVARAMHRISRGYAVPALVVPVFGIATAVQMRALGQVWLWISMVLTVAAAVLLVASIVPGQRRVLAALGRPRSSGTEAPKPFGEGGGEVASAPALGSGVSAAVLSRLGMTTGLFALTWVVVVVLMIVRPGSTTGVGL